MIDITLVINYFFQRDSGIAYSEPNRPPIPK